MKVVIAMRVIYHRSRNILFPVFVIMASFYERSIFFMQTYTISLYYFEIRVRQPLVQLSYHCTHLKAVNIVVPLNYCVVENLLKGFCDGFYVYNSNSRWFGQLGGYETVWNSSLVHPISRLRLSLNSDPGKRKWLSPSLS